MTFEEAKGLLKLSREARWSYPSSQGGDMVRQDTELSRWTDRLVPKRESFTTAIEVLVRNGFEDEAVETAANMWRLWMIARDMAGGRKFLDTVLGVTKKKSSRNRALALMETDYSCSINVNWRSEEHTSELQSPMYL